MQALTPFPSIASWPLKDFIGHEQNDFHKEIVKTNSDQSFFQYPPICDEFVKILSEVDGKDTTMAKKLNHNASERDRRKKMNDMYFSLRSLLPITDRDQMKKVSIPSIITRALKYIPELQREVETLDQKKNEINSRVDKYRDEEILKNVHVKKKQKRSGTSRSSSGVVLVNTLGDEEVGIQLCTDKQNKYDIQISEILVILEEEGLLLLNISCFESFGEMIFHNLHLKMQGTQRLNLEMLRKKLLLMSI